MSDEREWQDWFSGLTPKSQYALGRVPRPSAISLPSVREAKWHVVLVPEIEDVKVASFDTPEEAARYLKHRVGEEGLRAFIFWGRRIHVSAGTQRYLLGPDGERYPLFDLPSDVTVQEDGLLGPAAKTPLDDVDAVEEEEALDAEWDTEDGAPWADS